MSRVILFIMVLIGRYVLTALFCTSWSCVDRILNFFLKHPVSYHFDMISLSIPLLVIIMISFDFLGFFECMLLFTE